MNIAVIGMGYVGIPVAALFADVEGFSVTGIQRKSQRSGWKIDVLNSGRCPIEGDEPGLDELIGRVVEKRAFRVTDDFSVLREMDVILIDVQTPTDTADHKPQYLSLKEVSRNVGADMKKGVLVIIESTVAPGTTQNVVQPILERKSGLNAGKDFHLAYSYERVMPGKLIEYIVHLPRIVGGVCKESEKRAVELYKNIVEAEILSTDVLSAETAKTMENAYRDVNIAFANEMALIAESLGVDIYEIRELINSRSERHMHIPGIGVGGHCLPKDTWLLHYGLGRYGKKEATTDFISLARRINNFMPIHAVELAKGALKKKKIALKDAKVVIMGVAYLEDSDDTRNTPAYDLVREFEAHGSEVVAHDPYVRSFPEAELTKDLDQALKNADVAIVACRHKGYYNVDMKKFTELMRTPIVVDGRDVYKRKNAQNAGVIYHGIGKGK